MMERHDHINPWADKLQDIPVPEMNDAWKAMEGLLDEEMPAGGKRDRRRWFLLIILLLLLIGVCNCPGRMHRSMGWGKNGAAQQEKFMDSTGRESTEEMGGGGKGESAGGDMTGGDKKGDAKEDVIREVEEKKAGLGKGVSETEKEKTGSGAAGTQKESNINRAAKENRRNDVTTRKEKKAGGGMKVNIEGKSIAGKKERNSLEKGREGRGPGTKNSTVRAAKKGYGGSIGGKKARADEEQDPGGSETVPVRAGGAGDTVGKVVKDGDTAIRSSQGRDTAVIVKKAVTKKMLAQKKADSVAAAAKKADSMQADHKGWVAGIGLNQFFTVGQQEQSNYNSSGTTGGIRDYIPVPMIRYYFSRKLFVQLEAQFNTPQYTKKDLLASESKVDTTTTPTAKLQSVLYIKKLFYFNVPLSIHYSPFPNFYVGAGLQYSRLTNGVGLFQDKASPRFTSGTDTIKTSKVQSFKNDTTYQKMRTNELRLLLDLSYTYKRFIIGARYNRALSNFIDLRISDSQVTQSRNSSIQVYLRYILWDGRKKKLSPK